MTTLLPVTADGPNPDCEELRVVRGRARVLWGRARPSYRGPAANNPVAVLPSRVELDELWALIPVERVGWARRHVAAMVRYACESGMVATPQTVERDVPDRGSGSAVDAPS